MEKPNLVLGLPELATDTVVLFRHHQVVHRKGYTRLHSLGTFQPSNSKDRTTSLLEAQRQ